MKVRAEELGDEVDVLEGADEDVGQRDDVLVLDVLEELELSIRALGQHRCTYGERPRVSKLHNTAPGLVCALKGFMLVGVDGSARGVESYTEARTSS